MCLTLQYWETINKVLHPSTSYALLSLELQVLLVGKIKLYVVIYYDIILYCCWLWRWCGCWLFCRYPNDSGKKTKCTSSSEMKIHFIISMLVSPCDISLCQDGNMKVVGWALEDYNRPRYYVAQNLTKDVVVSQSVAKVVLWKEKVWQEKTNVKTLWQRNVFIRTIRFLFRRCLHLTWFFRE